MNRSLTSIEARGTDESAVSEPSMRSWEPGRGATLLGVALALGIHASVYALAPSHAASAVSLPTVQQVELEFFEPPPPPPAEPEEPAPAMIAPVEKPKPVVRTAPVKREAPPPKADQEVPPPAPEAPPEPPKTAEVPQPSEPAPALVAPADASSSHSVVQSAAASLQGRGTGGSGVPGGTGAAPAGSKDGVVGGTGSGSAQPVTLSLKNWRCPWPEEAEYEDFDQQLVAIRVLVDTEGRVEKAEIVSDPGHGFGAAARDCARRVRFTPAKDASGKAIRAQSPPIHVRFVR